MADGILELRIVAAHDTHELRRALLRPGASDAELDHPGDHDELTQHVLVSDPGTGLPLGVASIYREPHPTLGTAAALAAGADSWRVRGVGTVPEARRRGVASAMMHQLTSHARSHGARHVWCNARITAEQFYESLGWATVSNEFEIAGIGPHVIMELVVHPAPA